MVDPQDSITKKTLLYNHKFQQLTNGGEGSRFFFDFGLFTCSGVSGNDGG